MKFTYIDTPNALTEFCTLCAQTPWVAIDTEFLRQDTYFPKLSLVQIENSAGLAAIIDPLALPDLSPLWSLLTNPDVCKVFHSARQDLEVLYAESGQLPQNIFDTQIASVFLGYGDLAGFARVVEGELAVSLSKNQTRTNWHQRPLTDEQLHYAYEDVHYLAPLYQQLQTKLNDEQKTRLQQNFNELLTESWYRPCPEVMGKKIKTTSDLSAKQLAIVYGLAQWREAKAIERDEPRKWIISDDVIVSIAKRPPKTQEALYKIPKIKSSSVQQFGQEWIDCIDTIFAHPETWPSLPKAEPPLNEQQRILMQFLQSYLMQVSSELHINLQNLANKQQLTQLITHPNQACLMGWQYLLVEKPLRALLSGEKLIKIDAQKLVMTHCPKPN